MHARLKEAAINLLVAIAVPLGIWQMIAVSRPKPLQAVRHPASCCATCQGQRAFERALQVARVMGGR